MLACTVTCERWPLREPFAISSATMLDVPVILVTLRDRDGFVGRGEAAGIDYQGETPETMAAAIDAVRDALVDAVDGATLASRLPRGGARNALDCAWWDLRAKRSGVPAWRAAGLSPLAKRTTAVTLGLCDDSVLDRKARALGDWPIVKIKLDATRPVERVRIVRDALPRARLLVDANQAWTRDLLLAAMPALTDLGVELIEQPLPCVDDAALDGLARTIPIAADESCTDRGSLAALVGRYDVVNIKLDKCGGLSEALGMLDDAEALGLQTMIGNMCGTSLAMAPAFLVAQRCTYVDLDGPLLQISDRDPAMRYADGWVDPPDARLWG